MNTIQNTPWEIHADYFQACNCNYGCPCEFEAPPTMGYCEGLGAWRINAGRYGGVSLDGLGLAFCARWPGAIHEGNGTVQLFFDEQANEPQRDALLQIASGQAGGVPFEIIATTFSKILDPLYVPFKFNENGKHSTVDIGEAAKMSFEPIKNPVTGDEESVRIEHATGFIFKSAECVSGKVCESKIAEVLFSHPNKSGFVSQIHYHN